MASRNLLTLPRRGLKNHTRLLSQSLSPTPTPTPTPTHKTPMIYDYLAQQVKSKLERLQNPDLRFLRHTSPHPTLTTHTSIISSPLTKLTTLPNGLRVATESNLASKTASIGVWIDAGSRFEKEDDGSGGGGAGGVAHFLEHGILKGTRFGAVEDMGGHLNGYTTREQTAYFIKVLDKDVAKGMDVLGHVLQNSVSDDGRINRQSGAILREMEEVAQHHEEVIFDHLHATAFQHTPLGRTILGSAEQIKKITKQHIEDYISTHYAAHRMVISAAGAVKHEDIVELVKKLFTKLSSNPITTSQLVANEPAIFTGSEVRIVDDDMPLAHFAVAFNGASWTDPDSIALMVMQYMLGSWSKKAGGGKHMGSDLAQRVGINEIAESMMTFNTNYKDTGLFGVYAVAKSDCLDDLAYAIMYETSKLCYRVLEADVTRARNQLKSSLILRIDGTSAIAEDIGRQLITYGRRIPCAELFARIDAVDAKAIKRVANRFIFDQDIAIAAMGPIQSLPDYNWFRRRTYLLRY